jgi:hypothetical protein
MCGVRSLKYAILCSELQTWCLCKILRLYVPNLLYPEHVCVTLNISLLYPKKKLQIGYQNTAGKNVVHQMKMKC